MFEGATEVKGCEPNNQISLLYRQGATHMALKYKWGMFLLVYIEYLEEGKEFDSATLLPSVQ